MAGIVLRPRYLNAASPSAADDKPMLSVDHNRVEKTSFVNAVGKSGDVAQVFACPVLHLDLCNRYRLNLSAH